LTAASTDANLDESGVFVEPDVLPVIRRHRASYSVDLHIDM
jgi:hypothetical protein